MAGKQLSRNTPHRRATRRNMAVALFQHEVIRTTEAKAKELRRYVERLITIAKKGTLHARRRIISALGDREMFDIEGEPLENTVIQKLFDEIAPRYADRSGGYTRIIHLAERRIGDAGKQVVLQLVEQTPPTEGGRRRGQSRRRRRAEKMHKVAAAVTKSATAVKETKPTEQQQTEAETETAEYQPQQEQEKPKDEAKTAAEPETQPQEEQSEEPQEEGGEQSEENKE